MNNIPHCKGVYLIHLDTPLAHAKHYTGYANDIAARFAQHQAGAGARMLQVCKERGISFSVVRVWQGEGRGFERLLKNRRQPRFICPVCNPFSADHYPTARRKGSKAGEVECPF